MKNNRKKNKDKIDIYEINKFPFIFVLKSFQLAFFSMFSAFKKHPIYCFMAVCLFLMFGYSSLKISANIDLEITSDLISYSLFASNGIWGFLYPISYVMLFFCFFSYFCFIERRKYSGFLIFLNPSFYFNIGIFISLFLVFLWILLGLLNNNIATPDINLLNMREFSNWFLYDLPIYKRIVIIASLFLVFISFYISSFIFMVYFYFSFVKKMGIIESLSKALKFAINNLFLIAFIIASTIIIIFSSIYISISYQIHWLNIFIYATAYFYLSNFYAIILKNTIKKFKI